MENFWILLLKSAYFLVPAYFANMAPPLAKKFNILESLATPVDKGKKLRDDKHLFGANKTYRGFIVGMIGGALGGLLQLLLYNVSFFHKISISGILYDNLLFMVCFGALMGFGAIFGDLAESFFKRRLGVEPGKSLLPWDQIDLVFGAYLLAFPIVYALLSWKLFLCSILVTFFLHVLTNHIAYYLHIRREKW
jgi:CDP-2,3-bis-(O-geranylgeranyl)-sn-glycerol synthase